MDDTKTVNSQAQLCGFCSRWFSHTKLFPRTIEDIRNKNTLRRLEEIRANTQCPLCTMILSSLSNDPQVQGLTCEAPTYVHYDPSMYGTVETRGPGAEKKMVARIWFTVIVDGVTLSSNRNGTVWAHGIQVSGERVENKEKNFSWDGKLARRALIGRCCCRGCRFVGINMVMIVLPHPLYLALILRYDLSMSSVAVSSNLLLILDMWL